jgi:hypothetical protein
MLGKLDFQGALDTYVEVQGAASSGLGCIQMSWLEVRSIRAKSKILFRLVEPQLRCRRMTRRALYRALRVEVFPIQEKVPLSVAGEICS